MPRVLIVEDDPDIALGLEQDLRLEGYQLELVTDGQAAVTRGLTGGFDLILLDVMLPGKDGFQVCRELRHARVRTPIILLTAKSHEAEKILGLELGADDYITKPFSPMELRARIRAALRRGAGEPRQVYAFGDFELDFGRFEVRRGGRSVDLTPIEFKLLATLVQNRRMVLTRQQLLDQVWGRDIYVTDRVVDTHIGNLRKKIEIDAEQPAFLVSARGVGYRFEG